MQKVVLTVFFTCDDITKTQKCKTDAPKVFLYYAIIQGRIRLFGPSLENSKFKIPLFQN